MSLFLPNIPQAPDDLDVSQPQLLSNNQGLDTLFGIDHYKFSDSSSNKGFHNKVTTPVFIDSPPTGLPPVTGANPVFYGFQQTAPLGVLQYSRGPNNAQPSFVTDIQSPIAGISLATNVSTNILDFAGLTNAYAELWATAAGSITTFIQKVAYIYWNGSIFRFSIIDGPATGLGVTNTGSILQIINNSANPQNFTNLFWTLIMHRAQ